MFANKFMKRNSKTYRGIIFLLPLVYIFSFLLSPYFHHHADELQQNDNHKFHSHLFNDSHNDHSNEDKHSHNLDESSQHHFHFVKLSSSTTITTKRVTEILLSVALIDFTLSNEKHASYNFTLEKKPKNSVQQDRCVQNATNVSPPLA